MTQMSLVPILATSPRQCLNRDLCPANWGLRSLLKIGSGEESVLCEMAGKPPS